MYSTITVSIDSVLWFYTYMIEPCNMFLIKTKKQIEFGLCFLAYGSENIIPMYVELKHFIGVCIIKLVVR